jgi:LacI family transcriptional regulator
MTLSKKTVRRCRGEMPLISRRRESVEMVTLEEVAQEAKVSVSTASRALTGKGQVSRQTIARVRRIARKLGYRPNSLARGLKTNTSHLIGLIVHNIFNASFQKLAQVIQRRLFESDYHVILCISNDDAKQESIYLETLLNYRVDGLIIVPTGENLPLLEKFASSNTPLVTVIRRHPSNQFDAVLQSDVEGAYEATRYLIQNNHHRIGLIVGPPGTTSGLERYTGYLRALNDYNVPVDPGLIHQGPYAAEVGRAGTEALLALKQPATAIFCANHEAAQGTLAVLSERNLQIPGQMSLVCYEDSPWFAAQRPNITVVDNDPAALAELAVDMILQKIEGRILSVKQAPRELRVGARLVVRQSCRPLDGLHAGHQVKSPMAQSR